MSHASILEKISVDLKIRQIQVENTIKLLIDEECTIPFVARYRKERTGMLDEVQLRDIRDRFQYAVELEKNREKYLKAAEIFCLKDPKLAEQWPGIKQKFLKCETKQELEDLYLPYKPKRRTRAQIAKEKGLDPLLRKILDPANKVPILELAKDFVTADQANLAPELKVASPEEAILGAKDILAEEISENAEIRASVRDYASERGFLVAAEADPESTDPEFVKLKSKYKNYFDYREPLLQAAPHRIMAVRRGEAEKALKLDLEVQEDEVLGRIREQVLKGDLSDESASFMVSACEDSYKRLIMPSIETELRLVLKAKGEEEAIKVFAENLSNLLMLPPIPDMVVLGIDPGMRTGSKLAVIDETGKLLDHATVYPDYRRSDDPKTVTAKSTIVHMVTKYKVSCIAVGNGTGSKEIDQLVSRALKEAAMGRVKRAVVNEAGASVYSTDPIAREEFPDLDPTIRSAVSIARRLQDPLAELVKIDPRSIGVGQYQHDVNVTKLSKTLGEVVESCVNKVGVNVNTASYKLLSYVSGIGPSLAKNIVKKRESSGRYRTRQELVEVTGFGPKAFQQAAGFLRIPGSDNPLDNSAVHPESYPVVEQMVADLGKAVGDVIAKAADIEQIPVEKYVTEQVGLPTLKDIVDELKRPGRDPREDGARLLFSEDVSDIKDLKIGQVLKGTVSNVTNFGAFVDIGVHQDGLVHLSELSDEFIQEAAKVVQVGKIVDVRVIDVDMQRRRISLSIKQVNNYKPENQGSGAPRPDQQQGRQDRGPGGFSRGQHQDRGPRPDRAGGASRPEAGYRGPEAQGQQGNRQGPPPRQDQRGNRGPEQPGQGPRPYSGPGNAGQGNTDPRNARDRDSRPNARQNQHPSSRAGSHDRNQDQRRPAPRPPQPSFTLDDLMKKFGKE